MCWSYFFWGIGLWSRKQISRLDLLNIGRGGLPTNKLHCLELKVLRDSYILIIAPARALALPYLFIILRIKGIRRNVSICI
uniref:Uncharacterized protein n=1 Tax=Picea glauca TaxID=3330 RepID=A0A101M2M6_PICGL|nr:hypothetical protein ABT39_MTgene3152 [Picea glauca]QHR89041.1 hypothetical protein Q903MT_gene3060 [Picea sitchensis]